MQNAFARLKGQCKRARRYIMYIPLGLNAELKCSLFCILFKINVLCICLCQLMHGQAKEIEMTNVVFQLLRAKQEHTLRLVCAKRDMQPVVNYESS